MTVPMTSTVALGGVTLITNSTVADNTAPFASSLANMYQDFGYFAIGTVTVTNTILAINAGDNCPTAGGYPPLFLEAVAFVPVTDAGHNMESGSSCDFDAAGSVINTGASLGPLQNNGGPTLTHALGALSLAIDAGACADSEGAGDDRSARRGTAARRDLRHWRV